MEFQNVYFMDFSIPIFNFVIYWARPANAAKLLAALEMGQSAVLVVQVLLAVGGLGPGVPGSTIQMKFDPLQFTEKT